MGGKQKKKSSLDLKGPGYKESAIMVVVYLVRDRGGTGIRHKVVLVIHFPHSQCSLGMKLSEAWISVLQGGWEGY